MKKSAFLPAILFLVITTIWSAACSTYSSATNPTVYMKNSTFSQPTLRIEEGITVEWVNDDIPTHTVTADDGSFTSGDIPADGSYKRTFTTAGTYSYHCNHHPGMKATVIVTVDN